MRGLACGVQGVQDQVSEEPGFWGASYLMEQSWMGWADRLGGIAGTTLTYSIKPHFMEPRTSLVPGAPATSDPHSAGPG